jgi:peptidoglycan biosynthesis protein MviN/MurJ (putative lipid II flippase)
MNRMFAIGIVLDLSLNFLLIPTYKAIGSAVAALITHIFVAGAMVWLCTQIFPLKPSYKTLLRILGFTLFVLAADWLIFNQIDPAWPLKWTIALKLSLAMLSGLTGMLLFQMINIRNLIAIRFSSPED